MDSENDTGNRPSDSQDGLSEEAIIATLRKDLLEAEKRADLWKQQAQKARADHIESQSNAAVLETTLDSRVKELSRVQEDRRTLEETVRELRIEIESKQERSQECDCNADSIQKELISRKAELTRIQDECEKQRKLVEELRADRGRGGFKRLLSAHIRADPLLTTCALLATVGHLHREEPKEVAAALETKTERDEPQRNAQLDRDLDAWTNEDAVPISSQNKNLQRGLKKVKAKDPLVVVKELAVEEELTLGRVATIAEQTDKEQRDHAIAKRLDHELNRKNEETCMPEAGEAAQHGHRTSMRPVASSSWPGTPESQLEKAKVKMQSLKKRFEEMEATAYHYQKLHHQERSQHVRTYNQARMLEMEFNSARKHIHAQDEALKSVRNELAAVKQQLSDALNLSEVRGKELKGAQTFPIKTDTISATDVVQKVNTLNDEIFQMAAYLGEVLVYEVLEPEADRLEHRQAAIKSMHDRTLSYLGETLVDALAQHSLIKPKEESNPLLVQIIMQIALTNWCGGFGNRWTSYEKVEETVEGQPKEPSSKPSISKQADHDRFVSELYNSIRDHEDQAVAGRWRSLTKAHIPFSTGGWDHHLMVTICSIMGVAGWATRSNDEMGQIEKRLGSIFKPLLELRKATGEDVTSADLEISIIQSGQTFDPSYMEDAYADGRASSKSKKSAPEQVINTSGLGLQKVVVKRLKGGAVQKQLEILSMPKVVLEKTIKEALEPPPPRKNRSKDIVSDVMSELSLRLP
ncbi:hypothetical protein MD484_g2418, partial [Candolleomyces efflorescens]